MHFRFAISIIWISCSQDVSWTNLTRSLFTHLLAYKAMPLPIHTGEKLTAHVNVAISRHIHKNFKRMAIEQKAIQSFNLAV